MGVLHHQIDNLEQEDAAEWCVTSKRVCLLPVAGNKETLEVTLYKF